MVNVTKGILVECDPAMKQFLLHLDETNALGKKFILNDLDETHVFIQLDVLKMLQDKIDELMDKMILQFNMFPATNAPPVPGVLRESRSKDVGKIVDGVTRERRQKKLLEALEQDNFQDEPHADLVMNKKAPKFQEILELSPTKEKLPRKKRIRPEFYKKYRKSFAQLLEEDAIRQNDYMSAQSIPSVKPIRHFCNVCGLPSPYTCGQCGVRYCTVKCYKTHQETRCLKWIA